MSDKTSQEQDRTESVSYWRSIRPELLNVCVSGVTIRLSLPTQASLHASHEKSIISRLYLQGTSSDLETSPGGLKPMNLPLR